MQNSRARIQIVAGVVVAAVAILYFFPPAQFGFYPSCPLHSLTGLDCPGCGTLRATHQLLHGNFGAAFFLNPLFVIALPLLLLYFIAKILQKFTSKNLFAFAPPSYFGWMLLGTFLIFGVLRNLPVFSNLAP